MKKFNFVVMSENENGGEQFSYIAQNEGYNLLYIIERLQEAEKRNGRKVVIVHQTETKKQAAEIAENWNECAKRNGRLWGCGV